MLCTQANPRSIKRTAYESATKPCCFASDSGREGGAAAPRQARRQADDTDRRAGRLHWRQGRRALQARHLPLLSPLRRLLPPRPTAACACRNNMRSTHVVFLKRREIPPKQVYLQACTSLLQRLLNDSARATPRRQPAFRCSLSGVRRRDRLIALLSACQVLAGKSTRAWNMASLQMAAPLRRPGTFLHPPRNPRTRSCATQRANRQQRCRENVACLCKQQ